MRRTFCAASSPTPASGSRESSRIPVGKLSVALKNAGYTGTPPMENSRGVRPTSTSVIMRKRPYMANTTSKVRPPSPSRNDASSKGSAWMCGTADCGGSVSTSCLPVCRIVT
jgi:hypothetical protein